MKVVFFNSSAKWGGGEKWHHEMSLQMANRGLDVTVIASLASGLLQKSQRNGITTFRVNIGQLGFLNIILLVKLYRLIKQLKPDAIILNLPIDVKTAGIIARILGVKSIIYRRGSAIPIKNSCINRYLFKRVINQILVNSAETRKTILKNNPKLFDESKIKIVYNGINTDVHRITKSAAINSGPFIIGNLARLSRQKGQFYLVDMAKNLKNAGYNFEIWIGGEGELEQEIKKKVAENGLENIIRFKGFIQDPMQFLGQIHLFVFPSVWEGFGYSIVEAKLAGIPVVAFNCSSNPEVIRHQVDGILVKPFDVDEMSQAVKLLIDNPQLCQSMGEAGINDVFERFSVKKSSEQLFEYLTNL